MKIKYSNNYSKNYFDIPTLDEKKWNEIQNCLDSINEQLEKIDNILLNKKTTDGLENKIQKNIDKIHIELGLLDTLLGRTYTLEEVKRIINKLKREKKDKEKSIKNTDAWVMQPYNICITTYPPQFSTTIYHYNSPDGLDISLLNRDSNTKVFYTKEEAINYCKMCLGSEYQIIDIPTPKTIIFK